MRDSNEILPTSYIPSNTSSEEKNIDPKNNVTGPDISSSISRSKINSPFVDNIGSGSMLSFFEREKEAKEADRLAAESIKMQLLAHKHKTKKTYFLLVLITLFLVIIALLAYLFIPRTIGV